MVPENLKVYSNSSLGSGPWQVYMEKVGLWDKPDFVLFGLEDHINITKDTTDYLWYTTRSEFLAIVRFFLLLLSILLSDSTVIIRRAFYDHGANFAQGS